ncbi:bifunctional diguanylate cyclase/phosphodiesterase [Pseudorhizobium halotolerans]|uniref:Bifunctional diguanylate cyclase/phosphodiesterase n=1 Tax=Pseudorhizobium halotolerans TaxID=1233081 RepID=A0ABN7JY16_9HYPH|nr:EAL domain-containing protein [Pseudorhizobium halotolerans]CAD7053758.1 bifunctional diguanylate cyclase/phosphodiesterase [Pseudorhizobium halotolerans]
MNERQLFDALTLAVPGLVWLSDELGRVEFLNAHWTEFTGIPQNQGVGHGWLQAIHPADAAAFRARLPYAAVGDETVQGELRVQRYDGAYHRHLLNLRHVGSGKWVGCAIDAHEWLATELRDATQGTILEMAISGVELNELLAELCRAAERQIPGSTCSILLVDGERECFRSGVAPHLPTQMMDAVPNVRIGTGVGSCGSAAYEGRDVITTSIATDPLWETWRHLVLPLGLRACWSKPVFNSNGQVIASFGFYFREERAPSPEEAQELARLRGLASLAIERARMFEALRESEEHYRHTVEQNPQIPWTSDPTGQILSVSSRWTEMTGIAQADALGTGWLKAVHPDDIEHTNTAWNEALSKGDPVDVNYRVRFKNGEFRWARARATARRDGEGSILRWYGTVEDIHERHIADERLKRQAYQDDLTGLPNRRSFTEELKRRLADATKPIGLMVLDMDDFKLVNDRYGHLTGDAVLRLFARYLQRIVKPGEFVARLGGDEFAIICGNIHSNPSLLERARAIEVVLDADLKANRKARICRPSVGCTIGNANESPDEVFRKADLALYAAKDAGKAKVRQYTPEMRSAASKRSDALEIVRMALREDWVEPFYQPVIGFCDQSVRGFEALLRIRHPARGLILPGDVKDALDDPRQADALGLCMARKVVNDIALAESRGDRFGQVSINLATENLLKPGYLCTLLNLLKAKRLPFNVLKLEITERVLVDELNSEIIANLKRLRECGVGISLDDFGTGYASLVHLQTLPVNEIKIDRSFVSGLGTESNRGEIVKAMLGLAKSLGLTTVAEGIETEGEALKLAGWGCDFGQGYLFARPIPFGEAVAFKSRAAALKVSAAR